MGVIFDRTCMLWRDNCGTPGNCIFYDNAQLSFGFLFLCVGVSGVSLAAMIVAAVCYRAPTAIDSVVIKVNGGSEATELSQRTVFQTHF